MTSVLDHLSHLVSFNTESQRSNLPLIDDLEAWFRSQNVLTHRFPNEDGTKATLLATVGPLTDGGVILSGHTDVVPVEGQSWTTDPFKLRVDNGRAYGRGAVDMKGFLALGMTLLPEMQKSGLKAPVHMMFSYDEELTCLGVVDAINAFGSTLPLPRAAIVGEPTNLEVADAHKSVFTFRTEVKGFECHSSKPMLGANAVSGAAELIRVLDQLAEEERAKGDPTGRFDPPYGTVHVGNVRGGTARNIVPKSCIFEWEVRGVPATDEADVARRMMAYAEEKMLPRLRATGQTASVETICDVQVPGLKPDPGSLAETLALRLAGRNKTVTVPFGTEAGHFQAAGIPTVVCGPGSINQAHQPDEYIEVAELERGVGFVRKLIEDLSR